MNPKQLNLIKQAYDICKDSFDCDVCEKAADILLSIIRAETCGKTKSKFNIYDFCAKVPLRPVMEGIYHDKGFKVASNAKILVMLEDEYDNELESKIIDRNGNEVGGRYPNYLAVIPKYNKDEYTTYHINFDAFESQVKDMRLKVYSDCGKKKTWCDEMVVHIGDTWLGAEQFSKFLSFMQHVGTDEIYIKDNAHAVLSFVGESKAIIMPRCNDGYDKHPEEYYIINL